MIKSFSDHAANERTFLAWVRTAIAVMAFGFVIVKFDLFLSVAVRSLGARAPHLPGTSFGHLAGLLLVIAGIVIIAISGARFVITGRMIESETVHAHVGTRVDIVLAAMLALLGGALILYLAETSTQL